MDLIDAARWALRCLCDPAVNPAAEGPEEDDPAAECVEALRAAIAAAEEEEQ